MESPHQLRPFAMAPPLDLDELVVPDELITDSRAWRCPCGRTSLRITQQIPVIALRLECRHCGASAEWVPAA